MVDHDLAAATVRISGHGGDEINAYLAQPTGPGGHPGVLVIHHMPGWDEATKQITLKFAYHGYAAICPNLHHREGPGAEPDDAAAASRAAGGVPDDRFLGDVEGAVAHLRGLPASNGRVGCIGYCSGGRQSFLAACVLPLDAAVDCYGGLVVGTPPPGSTMQPVIDRAKDMRCPLLGLFGAEDTRPSPDDVAQIDAELTRLGKEHEFHTYAEAGHGFFAVDRAMYRVEAANAGWERSLEFFGRHLAA